MGQYFRVIGGIMGGRARLSLVWAVLATAIPLNAETIDPAQTGLQYAWCENLGWLNAEPLGDGGPGLTVGEDQIEGWMWGENIGWVSFSCVNTASCATEDYGVAVDGAGRLSGFAWAENVGWISMSCANTASCGAAEYGVVVDLFSGEFAGYAWAENAGWISFSCANTASCGTVSYGVTTTAPFSPATIFADGFESGDTTVWSSSAP